MLDNDSARLRSYGLLILRVVVGVTFIAHAYLKFGRIGMEGTTSFMTNLGVPAPALAAWFSVLAETFGGIALILGIFTLPFGLALVVVMIGAIMYGKRGGGFFVPRGSELELNLLAASLALALTGPGGLSLRNALRGRRPG